MLEMILNKNPARLTERVSKFIIYQVIRSSDDSNLILIYH